MKKYLTSVIIGIVFLLILIIILLVLPQEELEEKEKVTDFEISLVELNIEKIDNVEDLKQELNSLEKIISYLPEHYNLSDDELVARDLETVVISDSLSKADYAYLSSYLLKNIGIEPAVIRYDYGDLSNLVVLFRNEDVPVYLYLSDNALKVDHHGWSFADLIKAEEARLDIDIERYAYFPYGTLNFSEAISPYEWQYLD